MIHNSTPITEIAAIGNGWPGRIQYLQPRHILELGTGQGASGVQIMVNLPPDSMFTTINYSDGHVFGEQLEPYHADLRLRRIVADTIDPKTLDLVPDNIDLLFIDTTHEAWHAARELYLWQDKLQDGALVVVDDLDQHDMMIFWDSLQYEKSTLGPQRMFRYDTSLRYEHSFKRPERTTYGGSK